MQADKRLLLIANDFPPIGGGGVHRPFYFAKYLGECGWAPIVLTVKDVAYRTKDPSLLAELPDSVPVLRTESLELRRLLWLAQRLAAKRRPAAQAPPSEVAGVAADLGGQRRELGRHLRRWLFVPDDRVLWAPFAVAAALRAIRRHRVAAILATVPCYSSGVIGQILSRLTGVPLLLDLRDPWTRDPYLPSPTAFHAWLNARLEATSVARAARVILISEEMRKRFRRAYPKMPSRKFVTITNGYGADELASAEPVDAGGEFVLVYSGSLFAHHLPSFRAFCEAWTRLAERDAGFASSSKVWLVGKCDPEIQRELPAWPAVKAEALGYQPHSETIRYLRGASASLLLIKNLHPDRDLVTIPSKLFEYVGCGSPILMIGPEGDAADIVRETGGTVHREGDSEQITASLAELYGRHLRGGESAAPDRYRERYDRRHLAGLLAAELESVLR